ncbi:OmpA family protein [Flavobacterium undicola]|uniref:OmpA family protein n=1 Tax=Flavobacterium undicola TaxID=1932779 RepID=UPI001378DC45|nr:OmpA family protein [Flavobacterium undicola]MBA0884622.1 OmpA family protein [Flavobacterium undicola]
MKAKANFKEGLYSTLPPNKLTLKSILIVALVWFSIQAPVQAQELQYTKTTWWFGVAAGANFNFYEGSTYKLNSDFTPPATFHDGKGVGLFVAPLLEYHRPDTRLGFMLQAGYDNRKAKFDQVVTPCDCPADLKTNISYITVEPSLRFAPFKSNFYLFGGPRFAFNLDKSFNYQLGINPAYPNQEATPEVKGDLSDVKKTIISMQIGLGYDIPLSSQNSKTQFVLSPFASFHPYFGQKPRSIETLNITTIRAGVALKFGQGRLIPVPVPEEKTTVMADPEVQFSVNAPANVATQRRVREVFPLRNYVFFNAGSSEIPSRYKLLKKEEVKDFREDQLEMVTPVNQSGRSERQMNVYYNVINILGDRMIKNPSTTITLVGSSEQGAKEGKEMAESVKFYLVNTFGINASRISTKGQLKPNIPSLQPRGTLELDLLREGDRRVSIESSSPVLLVEFQSGPDAKSSDVAPLLEAPIESDVVFDVKGANEAFSVWSIQTTDESGKVQSFGPYTQESVSLSRKSILGDKTEGDYKIIMTGQTKSGKSVTKETSVHIARWAPTTIENGVRYSIIFEFNESKAITIYRKYLTDVVVPKIPMNGTVIIHGHADVIGNDEYNLKLSQARATEVKTIIEEALTASNRNDVKFEVTGYGEESSRSPFNNKFPEERSYNRTVIIDVFQK